MSDKIEEIRARCVEEGPSRLPCYSDRAYLLAEVDRLRAYLATQQSCCDGAAAQDAHVRQEREEHRAEAAKLRAEIERLSAELALKKSGFALQRGRIEKLRAKIDELMRSHEMIADVMRKESDRADEAWAEVERQRAEIERITRERDEARAEVARMKKLHAPPADLPWPSREKDKP